MTRVETLVLFNIEVFFLRLGLVNKGGKNQFIALHVVGMKQPECGTAIKAALGLIKGVVQVCHIGMTSGLVFVEVESLISMVPLIEAVESSELFKVTLSKMVKGEVTGRIPGGGVRPSP